jgi:hypothetical protein
VFLARLHGLPPGRVLVGALPSWLIEERTPTAAAIAQVAVRRAVLPDHPLAFEEPAPGSSASIVWPSVLAAALPLTARAGLIVRSGRVDQIAGVVQATRSAAAVALEAASSLGPLRPRGPALTMARGTVTAAVAALERVAASGWPSILGEPIGPARRGRLGADAVVERADAFDPLAAWEGARG